jgi:ATP-binding cassette, subfamily B, heavy metal transporter
MFIDKRTKEKVSLRENFRLYREIAGNYKGFFILIIILVLIGESARIGEKFLFKIIVDDGTRFSSGELSSDLFVSILLGVAVTFGVLIIIRIFGTFVFEKLVNRLDASQMFDLKRKFFNHITHLSHNFHTTHKTGSMISRMNRGTRAVEAITDFIVYNVTPLILQVLIIGGTLLYFDVSSAIVIVVTVIAFISYGLLISYKQQIPQYEYNRIEDIEKANMADIFANIDSVKYFGKEDRIKQRFANLARNTRENAVKFWDYQMMFRIGQAGILSIGTVLLLYFPLIKLLNGEISIGVVVFIYTTYLGLMGPLFGFTFGMRHFFTALGDLQALNDYGKIKNDIKDKPYADRLKVKRGEIEFRDIEFAYHKRTSAIKKFNLKIKPDEKVAFVGHSGSGKTTLMKLLYRFYDLDSGKILIDGKDIKDFKQESLRRELSIVPQEAILFDDTIYNNILFSRPSANREDVLKAMKFAQLDAFVSKLPKREKTIVGERGVKLSGGEKQRVSIARALLADKQILVLDEATSALDSKTESEIQKDLERLMVGRTSIIIAHRLSTIMKADRIVVLEGGKIVQIGDHKSLIRRNGVYRELWDLQKGGYIG